MDIKGINNSTPLPGIRPAAESAPVLQSAQNPEQVTVQAVSAPAGGEKAAAGKKAADSEWVPFKLSQKIQQKQPEEVAAPTDLDRVKEAMESIAKSLGSLSKSSGLEFSIDDDLGRVVVKVVDPETREVIKQFSSEDALALAKSLGKASGNLHQAKA